MLQSLQRDETKAKLRQVVCSGRDRERAMREVMRSYDPWQIVSAEPGLVGGILGFFQHEGLVITVDESARPPSEPASSKLVDTFLGEARDDVVLGSTRVGPPAAAANTSFSQVLDEVVSSLGEEPGEYRPGPSHVRAKATAATRALPPRALPIGHDAPVRWATACETARSCGVPDALIPSEVPDGEPPQLQSVFSRLPAPPPLPRTSGGLVAVVGSSLRSDGPLLGLLEVSSSVRPTAQAIARTLECDAGDIAVVCTRMPDQAVSPGLLARSPAEVASFAPGWRRDKVGVASVYAPALGEDQRWAREVLRAMRPSSVVAVVSAITKPEDVARWVRAIGGADALALVDVRRTCTPGAVLSIGIPVLSLDGESATPSCWAGVCAASSS
ncbi:MAG: hypothetical protein M0Z40_05115 [Actinomycetota bacterium]|nr:hypothetical protein [Actinomycetota bacterium]